tara:strand:+ start:161 stop:481 length:321 start_codon:yes stop_codon:yes gene_type:complete
MKKITREVTTYSSFDCLDWDTEEECLKYEADEMEKGKTQLKELVGYVDAVKQNAKNDPNLNFLSDFPEYLSKIPPEKAYLYLYDMKVLGSEFCSLFDPQSGDRRET